MWGEIKKAVNSDLSVPLNHLMWIEDLSVFGSRGYVFHNDTMMHELLESGLILKSEIAFSEFLKKYPQYLKNTVSDVSKIDKAFDNEFITDMIKQDKELKALILSDEDLFLKALKNKKVNKYFVKHPEFENKILGDKKYLELFYTDRNVNHACTDNIIKKIRGSYIDKIFKNEEYFRIFHSNIDVLVKGNENWLFPDGYASKERMDVVQKNKAYIRDILLQNKHLFKRFEITENRGMYLSSIRDSIKRESDNRYDNEFVNNAKFYFFSSFAHSANTDTFYWSNAASVSVTSNKKNVTETTNETIDLIGFPSYANGSDTYRDKKINNSYLIECWIYA